MSSKMLGSYTYIDHHDRQYYVYTSASFPYDVVVEPVNFVATAQSMKVAHPVYDGSWHKDRLIDLLNRYEHTMGFNEPSSLMIAQSSKYG
jgi:hypothetical protein